jgi:para-aminobenzoate synthetase/4-amino-4-deoxychorismate lyase
MSRRHSLPAEVYALVDATPAAVLLESTDAAGSVSRLFVEPLRVIEAREAAEVRALFAEIERATAAGLFAAGFFTYECGQCFEATAALRPPAAGEPLAWFGIYPRAFVFEHSTGEFVGGEPAGLASPVVPGPAFENRETAAVEANFALAESAYAERVAAIHEWIRAGDIYQLNFTAPFRVRTRGGAAVLYARLRRRQPVDYGAFVHWRAGRRMLSFSPELFFRVQSEGGRRIESRPMKGTAPRGRTTREDRERAQWLRHDAKNRSENVMIVDLVRNDLGRLCQFGSVEVRDLFAVERYPAVWQMTSTVSGELRRDVGYAEIFRALFPCGSITGAPKVRAMQLTAQVEDGPRGVYTGAIGYFSAKRTVFNVAIRTVDLDGDEGKLGVGSGIVIDSDAREEFAECLLKAQFLTATEEEWPEEFSLIESLLWRQADGYPLMDLHLDRLADSAEYFGFACNRDVVKAALLEHGCAFRDKCARKVRLLLDARGEVQISSEVLSDPGSKEKPARVRIAARHTDPGDRMLFHKTTHRRMYDDLFRAAMEAGFDDVLFLNTRDEVTEGAISNIFVEKDGRWFTPPIECGLLAGVYRRHLLETMANTEERVLRLQDLRKADAVYICNAVRGLRRVEVDWGELA